MNNISENIITAIDTIVQSSIKNLKLDSTITATITSVKDQYQGIYQIHFQDGDKIAYAINRDFQYKEGDLVLVKIPKNDYSSKFFIEGLETTENLFFKKSNIPLSKKIKYYTLGKEEQVIPFSVLEKFLTDNIELTFEFNIKQYLHEDIQFSVIDTQTEKDIFRLKDFKGNYMKILGQTFQTKNVQINRYENKNLELKLQYNKDYLDIVSITIQNVKQQTLDNLLYYINISAQNALNTRFSVQLYEKGKEITHLATYKWFYFLENEGQWNLLENENDSKIFISEEYKGLDLKVQAYCNNHICEAYVGNQHIDEKENIYGFLYPSSGGIDSSLSDQEYIIKKENMKSYLWKTLDGKAIDFENFTFPENSMLTQLWVDQYNFLHFKIKPNFNRNYYNNFILYSAINGNDIDKQHEIYFLERGDQGTNSSKYSIIVRPCDQIGNLAGSIFLEPEKQHLRTLLFYEGKLSDFELLEEISQTKVFNDLGISHEPCDIIDFSYMTFNFKIKNKDLYFPYIYVTTNEYDKNLVVYPNYIKYNKNGKNPDYITNIFINDFVIPNSISDLETRFFIYNNTYPVFCFIELENQNLNIINGNWNGQTTNTKENNIIDSSQIGTGDFNENQEFSGLTLGVDSANKDNSSFGLFGYKDNELKIKILNDGTLDISSGQLYIRPENLLICTPKDDNIEILTLENYIKNIIKTS